MDVYKVKIQSGGILDKLKLIIVGRGYLHNKELVGDTWSTTASMRTLKNLLSDEQNKKQGFINYISLEHYCKQKLRTEYL